MPRDHIWQQISSLLGSAENSITLIAPFIKKDTFKEILEIVPAGVEDIRCVTRWSVPEIAAGVSDPEIIDLMEFDKRIKIYLCHSLHAKLYIADGRCLIGSANLTGKATGRVSASNIEVLIESETSHQEIQRLLATVEAHSIVATSDLAQQLREQADLLREDDDAPMLVVPEQQEPSRRWMPETRRPERLYQVYNGKYGSVGSDVLAAVLRDLAELDIAPGLSLEPFKEAVRGRLLLIPELADLRDTGRLNMKDARDELIARSGCTSEQAQRSVETLAEWLWHFDEVHLVPVGAWEIRQGREIT
ncbi:phospholipase D family protein [Nocardiopsis metallicus]|uniref:PLD phosphodiesterase domain-containing protein n=1 Tax=Nocardiopsis metallicus TaxID=179819 RepID=A0A840WF43_9ACTN|nr:phospholipase D family protein [Nocardiopsis metallicus]MBB5494852.1 hypothetical protein [Nocardiopsis metallicus]